MRLLKLLAILILLSNISFALTELPQPLRLIQVKDEIDADVRWNFDNVEYFRNKLYNGEASLEVGSIIVDKVSATTIEAAEIVASSDISSGGDISSTGDISSGGDIYLQGDIEFKDEWIEFYHHKELDHNTTTSLFSAAVQVNRNISFKVEYMVVYGFSTANTETIIGNFYVAACYDNTGAGKVVNVVHDEKADADDSGGLTLTPSATIDGTTLTVKFLQTNSDSSDLVGIFMSVKGFLTDGYKDVNNFSRLARITKL